MTLLEPSALVKIVKVGVPVSDATKLIKHFKVRPEKIGFRVGGSQVKSVAPGAKRRLSTAESDRLVRLARLFAAAEALHEGNTDAARRWMESPKTALGGVTPLAYARTEVGAREVENLIGRLEHGVF